MPKDEKKTKAKGTDLSKKKSAHSTEPASDGPPAPGKNDPYVVGIGASAGGLEALQQFFEKMPEDPRIAFVVVTHLDPKQASLLPELLQKHTSMDVVAAQDGMQVRPAGVIVMPPNCELGILHGRLQLIRPPRSAAPRAPINYFLRLLAQDQRERAVGIILSGTGTDGTEGLKAMKGELGMVMVQDPATARFGGMPKSAIATGLTDYVLPPAQMPEKLAGYIDLHRQRPSTGPAHPAEAAVGPDQFDKILMMLRSQTGHDFSGYKKSTILRRVDRRMQVHQIESAEDYLRYFHDDPGEGQALFKELLIGVSNFFRDPEAFAALKEKALKPMLEDKPAGYTFRAWVAGCAQGEEAYSTAMVIQECLDEFEKACNVQVFATDIDEDAVAKARYGVYPGDIAADVGEERLETFFEPRDDSYYIKRHVREMVLFAPQSLVKDPPFTKLDLICCRNLMIYLDSELQGKLLPLFHYSLKPEGILFLGTSETISRFSDLFDGVDDKWKIYRRKEGASSHPPMVGFPLTPPASPAARPSVEPETSRPDFAHLVERKMLQDFTPPSVAVDKHGEILYVFGRTGRYLEFPPGEPVLNLFEVAREGLKGHLPSLVREAVSREGEAIRRGLKVKVDGDDCTVDLMASPLGDVHGQRPLVVVFRETPAKRLPSGKKRRAKSDGKRVEELERELESTRERLNTTVEELETANETLRAVNEEYQANNEELQSANEELTSSKEELQSLNEELESVNSELQNKNMELAAANQDMKTLMDSMEVPTVFLDNRLCIRRFTAPMGRLMNLRPEDVRRPFADLAQHLQYPDLIADVKQVLDELGLKEIETQTHEGRWYLIRIRPHRIPANVIDGVIITFFDVHDKKLVEIENEELRRFADSIVDTVRESLLVLDQDLTVQRANRTFYETFQTTQQETVGRPLWELGNAQWDIPKLRELLEHILPERSTIKDFEVEHTFPKIGRKRMLLNARRLKQHRERPGRILLAIQEIDRTEAPE